MAWDLVHHRLEDPHHGRDDLAAKVIRAIGNPDERFREDGLRPLRACRFAAQLGFTIEPATLAAIPRALDVAARVSAERVRDEIVKILGSPLPSEGFRLMHQTKLLELTLPELASCDGMAQGDLHCWDVLNHSFMACDAAPRDDLELRLAALLHDVGKAPTAATGPDGRPTFYGHERRSSEITAGILERLRFPTAVVRDVAHLVGEHMFNYTEEWSDSAVRRLVARVGEQHIDALIALRRADHAGMCPGNARRVSAGARQVRRPCPRRAGRFEGVHGPRSRGGRDGDHGAAGHTPRAGSGDGAFPAPGGGARRPGAQRAGTAAGDCA